MHFVDDVNLKAAIGRLITDIVDDLANFVDAAVGSAIDFKNVDGASGGDLVAVAALVAGRRGRTLFAIQCLGKNARGRGFADAAHAGKKIGMGDAVRR